jgi:hypothetical protein
MDGGGDAAEGVRGDPHEFGEVEVGSTELVGAPNELVGEGAAEAEGFVGALLADGLPGGASGAVSCGMAILPKTVWIQAVSSISRPGAGRLGIPSTTMISPGRPEGERAGRRNQL